MNATSAGGEVDALDPAGYGPITIGQAITIEGQGWSYIAPPASGNGITINAVSGNVVIHGVSLNGAGITGGTNGIVFNSGGSLTVSDCSVQNFVGSLTTGNGILIAPSSGTVSFTITNVVASNNAYTGVYYRSPGGSVVATGIIDHVTSTANLQGIAVLTAAATGGSATVAISNSVAGDNSVVGVGVKNLGSPSTISMSIDNVSAANNQLGIAETALQRAARPLGSHQQWHRHRQPNVAEHLVFLRRQPDQFEWHGYIQSGKYIIHDAMTDLARNDKR